MGKKRHTAKTGDRALNKSRTAIDDLKEHGGTSRHEEDDDPMYSEVDRFHNEKDKDFLRLERNDEEDSENEDVREEAVMDLGVGDSEDDDDDDDDDDDSSGDHDDRNMEDGDDDEAVPLSPSDEEDDEDEMQENVRDWGRKKSAYYNGDTADLEIGQDKEDAILEEQAAKQVLAARFQDMTEDVFLLSDHEGSDEELNTDFQTGGNGMIASKRDLTKLSSKEKQKLLDKLHPELLPLLSHFSPMVQDLHSKTLVVTRAVFLGEPGTAKSIGATITGQRYLLLKALLQSSAALNLAVYLLLKNEYAKLSNDTIDPLVIQNHPVMQYLQKLNSLIQKVEEGVEAKSVDILQQLDKLTQAAGLLGSLNGELDDESDEEDNNDSESGLVGEAHIEESSKKINSTETTTLTTSADDSQTDEDSEINVRRKVLTEARFGLRPNEIRNVKQSDVTRKKNPHFISHAGDDDDDENIDESQQKSVSQALSTTINSIRQRSDSRSKKAKPLVEHLDDHVEDDGELRRGLEMMEAELGRDSDDDGQSGVDDKIDDDPELDDDDDFYAKVSKQSKLRKSARKELYSVAPKFPRVEGEIDGERAISKMILKNRGLVAHKAKINRNPRVKKREQYRKAIIRRKGAVRDVRTNEAHKYGGEETGIKSGLSRSRKLHRP